MTAEEKEKLYAAIGYQESGAAAIYPKEVDSTLSNISRLSNTDGRFPILCMYACMQCANVLVVFVWLKMTHSLCVFQFPLFTTFSLSVPLLVVIWSNPEQGYNSATGHFVWLVWSPGTVYQFKFI